MTPVQRAMLERHDELYAERDAARAERDALAKTLEGMDVLLDPNRKLEKANEELRARVAELEGEFARYRALAILGPTESHGEEAGENQELRGKLGNALKTARNRKVGLEYRDKQIAALRARLTEAEALLRENEWTWEGDAVPRCLWCHHREGGHGKGCKLRAFLAHPESEKEESDG